MSSPVVNKDTLYYYKSGSSHYICFLFGDSFTKAYGEGCSLSFNEGMFWEWVGRIPKSISPVGQRCILQW